MRSPLGHENVATGEVQRTTEGTELAEWVAFRMGYILLCDLCAPKTGGTAKQASEGLQASAWPWGAVDFGARR